MKPYFEMSKICIPEGARFEISGDIDAEGAGRIYHSLLGDEIRGVRADVVIENMEFEDGEAVAIMVDSIRLLFERFEKVQVIRSPQALAHTLYRAGMLRDPSRLELEQPREEEGRAS